MGKFIKRTPIMIHTFSPPPPQENKLPPNRMSKLQKANLQNFSMIECREVN